jgi:Family of unknown function (DUF6504)
MDIGDVYGEPVQVRATDDGRPARFVWRARLYTVRAILEHWVVNREWWRDPQAEPGEPGERGQPELEFWRVEAASGTGMTAGVYELRRELPTDNWTLRRNWILEPISVVDPGLAVDPVHGDAPNAPRSPDPPQSFSGPSHHGSRTWRPVTPAPESTALTHTGTTAG